LTREITNVGTSKTGTRSMNDTLKWSKLSLFVSN